MQHRYYICFNLMEGNKVVADGDSDTTRTNPIRNRQDLEELRQSIESDAKIPAGRKVRIVSFSKYED